MNPIYRCAHCGWRGEGVVPARDLLRRLAPGDLFTDRECPECGALVQEATTGAADAAPVHRQVAVVVHEHRKGRSISVHAAYAEAEAALARTVRDCWEDRADREAPDDPSRLSDEALLAAYFDGSDEAFYAIEEILVEFPPEPAPARLPARVLILVAGGVAHPVKEGAVDVDILDLDDLEAGGDVKLAGEFWELVPIEIKARLSELRESTVPPPEEPPGP
jgi:predicted RNA-binding Zn-ribbon protein involved in translation (DUF1610 family)